LESADYRQFAACFRADAPAEYNSAIQQIANLRYEGDRQNAPRPTIRILFQTGFIRVSISSVARH
jgi:hypothetical protein